MSENGRLLGLYHIIAPNLNIYTSESTDKVLSDVALSANDVVEVVEISTAEWDHSAVSLIAPSRTLQPVTNTAGCVARPTMAGSPS